MIKNNKILGLVTFAFLISLSSIVSALPDGQNQLRLLTSIPKRTGETALSYMVSWRKGDSNLHRANGLIFINGADSKKPTSDVEVAHKIEKALSASIAYDAPQERGAKVKNAKNKAEVLVSNKAGFDLAHITIRDYSNQELHYNIPGKTFNAASVGIAVDLVYSAAVEYVDGFSSGVKQETVGGLVTVTVDKNAPIEIKTEGKTARQIEKELAKAMGSSAKFSSTSIYPNFVERKSRNYKPFDGGEVQLLSLNAKSITIDINDAGLGVLTKFKYPDINKPTDVAGNINYIFGILVVAVLSFFFYMSKVKKRADEANG